jgi:hypothetical protein
VGQRGLDFEALAADIATEASTALEVSEQIALLDRRIQDAAPRRLRALAALCDTRPDDEAQAGAVYWL